ncbi:hypothetical protein CWT12_03845 [Actinomyces sp. 432]|uniref:hypothetical protein n=1 Tax=Actinomyces sp. 432 TaxID=2057798 RepID=UPI001373B60C|nr:hypothetical protein [Actinomyces sp. 432]QHO90643.1 hypothetical protein CWT12_03845 [Actinomyces sp. 432]
MASWDELIAVVADCRGADSEDARNLNLICEGDVGAACECAISTIAWYGIIVPERIIETTRELCADARDFTEYNELMESQEEARRAVGPPTSEG